MDPVHQHGRRIDLLRDAGVDLEKPEPVATALDPGETGLTESEAYDVQDECIALQGGVVTAAKLVRPRLIGRAVPSTMAESFSISASSCEIRCSSSSRFGSP